MAFDCCLEPAIANSLILVKPVFDWPVNAEACQKDVTKLSQTNRKLCASGGGTRKRSTANVAKGNWFHEMNFNKIRARSYLDVTSWHVLCG